MEFYVIKLWLAGRQKDIVKGAIAITTARTFAIVRIATFSRRLATAISRCCSLFGDRTAARSHVAWIATALRTAMLETTRSTTPCVRDSALTVASTTTNTY